MEQAREIRQLMFVAEWYLSQAEPARLETVRKLGDTAAEFMPGTMPSSEGQRLTFLAASLSSAAIRLATIDDVLRRDPIHDPRPAYVECVGYFGWTSPDPAWTFPSCTEWLHVMLRDAIAHSEPPQDTGENAQQAERRSERQSLIQQLRFSEAYEVLLAIAERLRNDLTQKYEVVLLAPQRVDP